MSSGDERDALSLVVDRLRAEGWEVRVEPSLPEAFGDLRPDLVATRAGETLVVELAVASVFRPQQTRLAEAAREAGFAFRTYGVAPPEARALSYVAWWEEPPASSQAIERELEALGYVAPEDADITLFHVCDLLVAAGMRLEERVGLRRVRGLREEVEDFDVSVLVANGYLGERDGAAFDYARRLLARVGPATEPGGAGHALFREDAGESTRRLSQITRKLLLHLEQLEGDLPLEVVTSPVAAATVPPDASGLERTPVPEVAHAAEALLASNPDRQWRNDEVHRALLARGIATDRRDISAALVSLYKDRRAHRVKRGVYSAPVAQVDVR